MIRIGRNHFRRLHRFGLAHNITPTEINRRDRACLRVWFLELYAGPLHFWISGNAGEAMTPSVRACWLILSILGWTSVVGFAWLFLVGWLSR